jgi:geranylgeranyl diphosphate synthase type II
VSELARAAGTVEGMIGGQVADIEAEGKPVKEANLHYIHRSKTGAMIRAAIRMGAIYARAEAEDLEALSGYGQHIGLAFQVVDDILDVVGTSESLGKTAGKDTAQRKATFPALYGIEGSRRLAAEHLESAKEALLPLGSAADWLGELAERIVRRTS